MIQKINEWLVGETQQLMSPNSDAVVGAVWREEVGAEEMPGTSGTKCFNILQGKLKKALQSL